MTDPLTTAIHEIGHALIQSVFGIGPQYVKIYENDGDWFGKSLPKEEANSSENFPRLLVSEMAGPIAQICLAPESLGDLQPQFSDSLLVPASKLYDEEDRPLDSLGWEGDLVRSGLVHAARAMKPLKYIIQEAKTLFESEELLFAVFNQPKIRDCLLELAHKLRAELYLSDDDLTTGIKDVCNQHELQSLCEFDLTHFPVTKRNA